MLKVKVSRRPLEGIMGMGISESAYYSEMPCVYGTQKMHQRCSFQHKLCTVINRCLGECIGQPASQTTDYRPARDE